MLENLELETKKNIKIKLRYCKITSAKTKLESDENLKFHVFMEKRNPDKNSKEKKISKQEKLKVGQIYFNDEYFTFTDLDLINDYFEVSILFIPSTGDNATKTPPFKINISKLFIDFSNCKEKFKDAIEVLQNQNVLSFKYAFFGITAPENDIFIAKEIKKHSLNDKYSGSDNKLKKDKNESKLEELQGVIQINNVSKVQNLRLNNSNSLNFNAIDNVFNIKDSKIRENIIVINSNTRIKSNYKNINVAKENINEAINNTSINNHEDQLNITNSGLDKQEELKRKSSVSKVITDREELNEKLIYKKSITSSTLIGSTKETKESKDSFKDIKKPPINKNSKLISLEKSSNQLNNILSNSINLSSSNQDNDQSNYLKNINNSHLLVNSEKQKNNRLFNSPDKKDNPMKINQKHESIKVSIAKINKNLEIIELNYEDFFEYDIGESFIESIFLSGLPFKDQIKIITDKHFNALCGHKTCTLLNSYKADILFKFPNRHTNDHQISSSTAALSFNKGIKPCFYKDFNISNDFINFITNEAGRFYLYNYFFWVKYDLVEFVKIFGFNPLSDLMKDPNINESLLNLISEMSIKDEIFLPYCLSVVSKSCLIQQVKTLIQSFFSIGFLKNSKESLIYEFLKHVCYEVPIPNFSLLGKNVMKVKLPYAKQIEFSYCEDLPFLPYDLYFILDIITIENIVVIFHLMLLEKKMVFIGKNSSQLSKVLLILTYLLYPLVWNYTFIPVIAENMFTIIQAMMPFILGIEENLLFIAKEQLEVSEDIFVIDLNKNTIDYNEENGKTKKVNKKNIKTWIGDFNQEEWDKIEYCLKEYNTTKEEALKEKKLLNKNFMNKTFLKIFSSYLVFLFGDYMKYLTYIDGFACFNQDLFINNKSQKHKVFFLEIISTQNFSIFINNNPSKHSFFNKLVQRLSGRRTTNLQKPIPTGILGTIFNKKKYLAVEVKDFINNSDRDYNPYEDKKSRKSSFNYNGKDNIDMNNKSNISETPNRSELNLNKLNPKSMNNSGISNKSNEKSDDVENNSGDISELNLPPFFNKENLFDLGYSLDDYMKYSKGYFLF